MDSRPLGGAFCRRPVPPDPSSPIDLPKGRSATRGWRRWVRILPFAFLVLAVYKIKPWEAGLDRVQVLPLVLALGINLFGFIPLRALRWRVALHDPPSFATIVAAMLEGFVVGAALGFGSADAVRSARLRRSAGTFQRDFGSTLAERGAEFLALALLVILAVGLGTMPTWALGVALMGVLAYAAVVAGGAYFVAHLGRWPRVAGAVASAVQSSTPRRIGAMVVLSAAGWTCEVFILRFCLNAFGLPDDFGLGLLIVIGINIVIAIPGPPLNMGTFEAGVVAALATRTVSQGSALAFAISYHVLMSVPIMALGGLVYAWRELRGAGPR